MTVTPIRVRVVTFLRQCRSRGATDDAISVALGVNGNSTRPGRVELCRQGLVVDSGRRRRTSTGSPATVWVLAEHASADARRWTPKEPTKRFRRAYRMRKRSLRLQIRDEKLRIKKLKAKLAAAQQKLSGLEEEQSQRQPGRRTRRRPRQ